MPRHAIRPRSGRTCRRIVGIAALLAAMMLPAAAQEAKPMTAAESDPVALGWMVGAPPPADKIIRFTDPDYFSFPKLRWTVCHFRQLMPTIGVGRGLGPLRFFERRLDDSIDALTFTPLGSDKPMRFSDSLAANYTDGIAILHDGKLVYERYFGCLDDTGKHGAMSVTKSLTGLLGEMLVAEGRIDDKAKVATRRCARCST
jgi:CubicO group peptidase (beta-lactamase class C family)